MSRPVVVAGRPQGRCGRARLPPHLAPQSDDIWQNDELWSLSRVVTDQFDAHAEAKMFDVNHTPRHKHPGTRRAALAYGVVALVSVALWCAALVLL